jgi:hypothetical protein
VADANLVEQFLREQAWWRLDSAGPNPVHVARSVVALLAAAAYVQDMPDDAPELVALDKAGCFRGDAFDPGPRGAVIVREWQLAENPTAGPAVLLAELARAARLNPPAASPLPSAGAGPLTAPGTTRSAAAIRVPRS